MSDREQREELSAQLRALKIVGADYFRGVEAVVHECEKALQNNAVEHDWKYNDLLEDYEELNRIHDALLERYEELRKDYEASKTGQVNGRAATALGGEQAYVTVLVDAHSHKFVDSLIVDKSTGGPKAAQLLRDSVKKYLRENVLGAGDCRIEVRAYANLKSLSEDAHKRGLVDDQLRSLAPFTSGFSRMNDFDFVDIQDEGSIPHRVNKRLNVCIGDDNCKHIFFAASGNEVYVQAVKATANQTKNMTLVQGESLDQRIFQRGVAKVAFPEVFRTAKDDISVQITNFVEPSSLRRGLIPVNAHNERLDIKMSPPTDIQWRAYAAVKKLEQPCDDFTIRGACGKKGCAYGHSQLKPDALYCHRHIIKQYPCHNGGECRELHCPYGHVCLKYGCQGKYKECKLEYSMHKRKEDLVVAEWIQPDQEEEDTAKEAVPVVGESVSEAVGEAIGDLIDLRE